MEKFSKRVLASHVYGRLDAIQHEHRFDPRDGWAQVRALGEEKNRAYGEYDALLREQGDEQQRGQQHDEKTVRPGATTISVRRRC